MRHVAVLVAGVGIVLGAAALTAPVHDLLVGQGWLEVEPNQPHEMFLKVFRRLLLIPLVALVFVVLRPWRDGDLSTWGLRPARPTLFAQGWTATLLVGAVVLAVHLGFGWQGFEDPIKPLKVLGRAGRYLVAGLFIATLEEWFFRAWLWTRFGRAKAPLRAALLTSALYAALHAFRPGALDDLAVTHDFAGAMEALFAWLAFLLDPVGFGRAFVGLFLFGLLLSGLLRRTGSLWTPIGVHAAGILLIYVHGAFTESQAAPWLAGTKRLYDGVPGWIVLGAAGAWAWRR